MIETSIVKALCALIAALMAGATFGFLLAAILANSKYRDYRAEEAPFDGTQGNGYQPLKYAGEGTPRPPG